MSEPLWMTVLDVASLVLSVGVPIYVSLRWWHRRRWWLVIPLTILTSWACLFVEQVALAIHAAAALQNAVFAGTRPPQWAEARGDDGGMPFLMLIFRWFPSTVTIAAVGTWMRLTKRAAEEARGFDVISKN